MRDIIISIHPKHVEKIFEGKKTLELRKTIPHNAMPFRALVYETKTNGGSGKIIGDFICDGFDVITPYILLALDGFRFARLACVEHFEMYEYADHKDLYAWHIVNPTRYTTPKPLSDYGLKRPPQSWCYLQPKCFKRSDENKEKCDSFRTLNGGGEPIQKCKNCVFELYYEE